jgi:hypothetical protein
MDARSEERMSAVPVASYLTDFRNDRDIAAGPAFVPFGRSGSMERSPVEDNTLSAQIEAARASGFADGEAAGKALFEARLEQERDAWTRRLEAERQAWAHAEAEKLAQRLTAELKEVEGRIAQATARVLEPLLQRALREQAIADLQAELHTLLAKDAGIAVSVAGPPDVLEALRNQLDGTAPNIAYVPNGEPDVRITAGQTILETRLAAWAARIREAVK